VLYKKRKKLVRIKLIKGYGCELMACYNAKRVLNEKKIHDLLDNYERFDPIKFLETITKLKTWKLD
jgi:hypothetical protein